MPDDSWKFTEADRERLQPLLDRMMRMAKHVVRRACDLSDTFEGRIAILQGGCEYIAERIREEVLQQVDRGEWKARDILTREDIDVTIHVDAEAAAVDPDANLIWMSILPTWVRGN